MSGYDIADMDDDALGRAFEQAFRVQVDDLSNDLEIGAVDVSIERGKQLRDVTAVVSIYAMAEHTPREEVHDPETGKTARGAKVIKVEVENRGEAVFDLADSRGRGSNYYDLLYKMRR